MTTLPRFFSSALTVVWASLSSSACLLAFPHDFRVEDGGAGGGGPTACAAEARACDAPEDCPEATSPCVIRTCAGGCCGTSNVAAGEIAPSGQTEGDCTTMLCDGDGQAQFVEDEADVPAPESDCHEPACLSGAPVQGFAAAGKACSTTAMTMSGVCDTKGHCVECSTTSQCQSGEKCTSGGQCVVPGICNVAPSSSNIDCDQCLTAHCCAELVACGVDPDCSLCPSGMGPPDCADPSKPVGKLYAAWTSCVMTGCPVCNGLL